MRCQEVAHKLYMHTRDEMHHEAVMHYNPEHFVTKCKRSDFRSIALRFPIFMFFLRTNFKYAEIVTSEVLCTS